MANFKPGDIVTLKSSIDPIMTVESVTGDEVVCVWHTGKPGNRKAQSAAYKDVVLAPFKPRPPFEQVQIVRSS